MSQNTSISELPLPLRTCSGRSLFGYLAHPSRSAKFTAFTRPRRGVSSDNGWYAARGAGCSACSGADAALGGDLDHPKLMREGPTPRRRGTRSLSPPLEAAQGPVGDLRISRSDAARRWRDHSLRSAVGMLQDGSTRPRSAMEAVRAGGSRCAVPSFTVHADQGRCCMARDRPGIGLQRRDSQPRIASDSGIPSSVIRLRMFTPIIASVLCASGERDRSRSPMMCLNRHIPLSARAC